MDGETSDRHVAFSGLALIAEGALGEVARAVREVHDADPNAATLVFSLATGRVVDLDLRGAAAEVEARYATPTPEPRRGRPRLGVQAREVTLLPRHWEWLARQPGGASATLRRLTEAAARAEPDAGRAAARRDAAYRFMSAVAGDLEGFEEASRRLFAGDAAGLRERLARWPEDVARTTLAILEAA